VCASISAAAAVGAVAGDEGGGRRSTGVNVFLNGLAVSGSAERTTAPAVPLWSDSETTPLRLSRMGDTRCLVRQNPSENIAGLFELVRLLLRRFGGGTGIPQPDRVPAGLLGRPKTRGLGAAAR
jgi:hypothetical protein